MYSLSIINTAPPKCVYLKHQHTIVEKSELMMKTSSQVDAEVILDHDRSSLLGHIS